MRQFLGTLDYQNGRLVLRERTEKNTRMLREDLQGRIAAEIPFALARTHLMMARGRLNGRDGLTFFVDSGLGSHACFVAPIQTLRYVGIPEPELTARGSGGGGTFATGFFPIETIGLGSLRQSQVTGGSGPGRKQMYWAAGFIQDGLISHQFLRKYASWTLDFDNMTYIFER